MKTQKILTIVIPSYNTEDYINECLPFFLDVKILEKIEILIINDGSKDRTRMIAEEYVNRYPNTICLINKNNGGHGSVVNRGIREARGKYFKVVDGDDWVIKANLVELVDKLESAEADIILNPYIRFDVKRKRGKIIPLSMESHGYIEDFDKICENLKHLQLHQITYRTSILKENDFYFQEGCYYEDLEYDLYAIPYIKKVILYDFPVYVYRYGTDTQSMNPKNLIRNASMHEMVIENMMNFYKTHSQISTEKKNYMMKAVCSDIRSHYGLLLKMQFDRAGKDRLYEYDMKVKRISDELYRKLSSFSMNILRTNTWIGYLCAYMALRLKMKYQILLIRIGKL